MPLCLCPPCGVIGSSPNQSLTITPPACRLRAVTERAVDVLGPQHREQTVDGVVSLLDQLVLVGPGDHRHDRAEDLLLGDAHVVVHAGEDGGLLQEAGRARGDCRRGAGGALLLAELDVADAPSPTARGSPAGPVTAVVEGVCRRSTVPSRARARRRTRRGCLVARAVRVPAVQTWPELRDHHAGIARFDGDVDIGVGEDHDRALAAELQVDPCTWSAAAGAWASRSRPSR